MLHASCKLSRGFWLEQRKQLALENVFDAVLYQLAPSFIACSNSPASLSCCTILNPLKWRTQKQTTTTCPACVHAV